VFLELLSVGLVSSDNFAPTPFEFPKVGQAAILPLNLTNGKDVGWIMERLRRRKAFVHLPHRIQEKQ